MTAPMDARPSSALWDPEQGQRPTVKPCTRCQSHSRVPGQRWCRACLTEYARVRRQRQRATLTVVSQAVAASERPVTPVSGPLGAITSPPSLICGAEAPADFPPGCGLPFTPRVPWRPYYCCNGCGAREAQHSRDCSVGQEPVRAEGVTRENVAGR